ncbi:NADH-ubiquinone oxidoreductase chain 5-like, partial [Labrus mixtus]|uniref:NADH-ubiquinone oxidoreductase chain 5-like n=1 Tax=Labrus mixtus TaxID=508554 RepID=UPI0029C0AC66
LPAAIAAPTPISALVHSSTLVTAGVYLLFRSYFLFSQNFLFGISLFGILTASIAFSSALFELDVKKIVALSTLSHIGVIVVILNFPFIIFSHLIIHAYFKALLFIVIGIAIHFYQRAQDASYYGPLNLKDPLALSIFIIRVISMCGAPFISGYFRKDCILETAFILGSMLSKIF